MKVELQENIAMSVKGHITLLTTLADRLPGVGVILRHREMSNVLCPRSGEGDGQEVLRPHKTVSQLQKAAHRQAKSTFLVVAATTSMAE